MMLMWLVPLLLIVALLPGTETRTSRTWVLVVLTLFLIPILGGMFMMGGMGIHAYGGWNWVSAVIGLLTVGGLAAVVYALIKRSGPSHSEEEQLLRLRLAKGEITPAEYDLLREKLAK
jgi:uncharacterized membrane protein